MQTTALKTKINAYNKALSTASKRQAGPSKRAGFFGSPNQAKRACSAKRKGEDNQNALPDNAHQPDRQAQSTQLSPHRTSREQASTTRSAPMPPSNQPGSR